MSRAWVLAISLALLTGCSQGPDTDPAADQVAAPSTPTGSATVATPAAGPGNTASPDTPVPAPHSILDLGLTAGVYAASGSTCPPAMASLATFDGSGFGSRNFAQCVFSPESRDGTTFKGTQACTDTASGERVVEDLTVTVASAARFTQENRWGRTTFELCPDETLSDWTG